MFFCDLGTTLLNGSMIQYLEANPLYQFGGLYTLVILNFVVMGALYFFYLNSKDPNLRFVLMWGMVMVIVTRIIVSYMNYQTFLDPPTIEQAISYTSKQKMDHMISISLGLNLLPLIQTYLTYFFWSKDHVVFIKNG
jgi:hypothetical protein